MGIFGSIIGGLSPLLGSVLGASQNRKAIKRASAAQIAAQESAIGEERRQFDLTRQDFAPFTSAGRSAVGQMGDLIGLNGDDVSQRLIEELQSSPMYTSALRSAEEGILQNASATGGLRGGNTIGALADFRGDLLAKTIEQQLSRLGGIANMGAGMSTTLGGLRSQMAGNVGGLMVGQGSARAGSILGRQQMNNNLQSQIQQFIAQAMGAGMGAGMGGMGGGGPSKFTVSGLQPDVRSMVASNPGVF